MYAVAVWLQRVKEGYGERLVVNWKYFSLEQVNSQEGPDWKLWEQPDDYPSRGLLAFRAAEAARRQGNEAFERFHLALLRARHEQRQKLHEEATVWGAAQEAGLDLARFKKDLPDRSLLAKLAEDHTTAVERYGVFGTPTLVFPNGRAAYLKMKPPPPPEETLEVFETLCRVIAARPYIEEIKRPVPPPSSQAQ